jgi:hypothetical protein
MPQQNQTKIPARQIIPSTGTEFNLIFGTYLGGTNADAITSIAFDTLGNVYVGGSTGSLNFPTFDPTLTPIQPIYGGGNSDGFLTQVHKNGQVLTFSSYLGGSGDDAVSASVADLSNNLYVAGRTTSGNFLVKNAAQSTLRMANDAFLTKVQPLRSGVATLSTTTLVFTGAVNTTSAPQIVRITNTGELPLTITNVALTTSDASQFSLMNGCPLGNLLLPQTSCELTVRFNPTIARLRQAAIVVETDVLETNQQFVTLLGDQLANQVTLNPTTLSFTAAVGNTDSKTLTLTNTGSEPLTINSIVLPSSDFTFTSDCLNGDAMLNGGESCTLNVTFRPTTAGRKDAVVSVSTSTGILTANLTGTQAAAGQLNLSPASLRFTTAVGTTSPAQRLTLTNTGSAPVCVRQITINSNDFIFTSNCIGSVNQSLTNGCLAVDESCTIDVSFRPTVAGSRNATLTITTDSGTATASLFGDNPNNGGGGDGGNGNGNGNNNLDIVELSQASYSVKEGEIFAVTVTRQGTGQQEIAVALVTNNTTTTNRDFSATSTIVTFEAGDFTPKTIMIDTVDDSEVEGTEFAEVQLGNPTNANLGLARANLIITDTEVAQPGRFQFSPTDIQVDEGARTATVTVTRSNGNNVPVTLNYLVSDGSAMAGSDYEQTAGTLTFSPGVNSQSFSVRIIDDGIIEGNETIAVGLIGVTNGGVIVNNRATITITDNDQPVNLGRLEADLNPVNFGGVNPGQSATSRVLLRNAGGQPVRIQSVATSGSGFNILGSFAPVTLMPNQTTPVMLTFRPTTTSGQANGMLLVDSDSNDLTISLQAQIIDTLAPSIIVISPNGGELLDAGRPTTIQFRAEDNGSLRNLVVGFMVNTATGVVQGDIARVDGNTQQVIWNIPPTLDSANARIVVTAVDRNGNQANGMSGLFSIRRAANNGLLQNTITFTVPPAGRVAPPSSLQVQSREIRDNAPASAPILEVAINFDPPPTGQIAPPQNVRVRAREFLSNSRNGNSTASSPNLINKFNNLGTRAVNPTDVVAYNIYRIPQRATGTPPTAEELIRPENLVATIDSGNTSFTDRVSTAQSNNYTYSITGFFGNGQMGGGSVPTGTNLPVIVNPSFEKGSIFVNVPNSFIQNGARMIVNDTETYSLQLNDSGTRFFTPKGGRSQGNNLTVKQLLPRGRSVKLIIRNPDGNTSTAVMFSRMARQAMVVNQQIAPREIGDFDLIGYNLYRVPQPLPGQPMPTPEQMIAPENLVGSVPGGTMVFTDLANPTLSSSGNFMYSITGFFGNGQMSGGSVPAGTNLPVVVNPTFEQRMLFINVPNSFIQNGARMIINDTESFPLELNESGTQFRVSRRAMSTPNGTTIDRAIPRGVTVRLTVRNPDGKESVSVMFRRN